LRERIGESLRTVNRSAALPAVTTTSLAALQKYARGVHALDRESDYIAGITLLEEALTLDPTFGMAWRKLAVALSNSGESRERVVHAATKAYELRDRMSLREREFAVAFYQQHVAGDLGAAIQAYRSVIDVHRDDHAALNNLALLYSLTREPQLAVEYYERAIASDTTNSLSQTNIISAYMAADRLADAELQYERHVRSFGEAPNALQFRVHLHVARENYDSAMLVAQRMQEIRRGDPVARQRSEDIQGDLYVLHGRLTRAWRHRQEAVVAALERGRTWQPLVTEIWEAERDVLVRRRPDAAVQRLDRAVAAYPPDAIEPLDRPYRDLADAYSLAGRADRARFWLNELQRNVPEAQRGAERVREARSAVGLALTDGDNAGSLRLLDRLEAVDQCTRCVAYWRAHTLDRLGDERAIAEYERYLSLPGPFRLFFDNNVLAGTYERLAELYAERGDIGRASRYATRFIELWRDADAELQPRVAAKRDWLASLAPDR
jgi:eukaryotic-like serine/threonine-protein kinase